MERIGQIVALAISIYTVVAVDPTIEVKGPTGPFQKGQDIELSCKVTNLDVFVQGTKWYRVDNTDENLNKELSSHNIVTASENKYSIVTDTTERGNGIITYKLTIKDLRKKDDGFYKCVVIDTATNSELDSKKVEILFPQPISSLSLKVGSDKFDSGKQKNVVNLDKFEGDMPIICEVKGSNPLAEVEITIGGIKVTPKFKREDEHKADGITYESVRRYDTVLDSTGKFQVKKADVGKPIVCKAWIKGNEAEAMEVTATIKVKEPPVAHCVNQTTRLDDRRFTITCTITSVPRVTDPTWLVDTQDDMARVPPTGTDVQGYVATTKTLNETTIEITIEIDKVEKKHFDATFTLEASTGKDTEPVNHVIRIQEMDEVLVTGDVPPENTTTPAGGRTGGSTGGQTRLLVPTAVLVSVLTFGAIVKRLL